MWGGGKRPTWDETMQIGNREKNYFKCDAEITPNHFHF